MISKKKIDAITIKYKILQIEKKGAAENLLKKWIAIFLDYWTHQSSLHREPIQCLR
jgi:hypothetical protein